MRRTNLLTGALAALAVAGMLAGCGGGGGGAGGGDAGGGGGNDASFISPPEEPSALGPACTDCAALDARTYAGSGVGIWERTNAGGADLDVPVDISGLTGQDVTLVLTNESGTELAFPAIRTTLSSQLLRSAAETSPGEDALARIAQFNREGWAAQLRQARSSGRMLKSIAAPASAAYTVGDTRGFYHELDRTTRTATLRKRAVTRDGQTVNVWVEDAEYAPLKVSEVHAEQLASDFARAGGIHEMLTSVGGPLWGPHDVAGLLAGTKQPLDIVVLNFDRNGAAFGVMGYFWALHLFSREADARSNESLSMYLDAETLYLGGLPGQRAIAAAMAHEGMHMSNFYRRAVLKGPRYAFESWLEEMSAMMMEDAAAWHINTGFNPTRDMRLPDYLNTASYNCALKDFQGLGEVCNSYAVGGTFGGFLLRQHGIAFLRNLLGQGAADSEQALRAALRETAGPQATLERELRRFAASAIGALPAEAAPAGFGFPAREDSGFTITGIDAAALASLRKLPDASPATLAPYGSFAVVRQAVRDTFSELVRVPPGATLSVIVH